MEVQTGQPEEVAHQLGHGRKWKADGGRNCMCKGPEAGRSLVLLRIEDPFSFYVAGGQ